MVLEEAVIRYLFLIFITICFCIPELRAQNGFNPDSKKPLVITADGSLEWHRNDFYFKANKNVKAAQGGTVLFSDVLVAKYDNSKDGSINISTIKADGHVKIKSAQSTAYGDHAVYSISKGYAVMKGKNLRLISKDQTVTARDKFQYWVNEGRLEAIGNAVAVRDGDKLEADKIIATFVQDNKGKRVLKTLEALGSVVITTPDEVLTGNRAIYQADSNIAQLHENVKITRGLNVLEGERAQVNLVTNISKIFGGTAETGGRVRGIFYPGSVEKSK